MEYAGEYQDALGELAPSEESRVLVEEWCRNVGKKGVQGWEMKLSRVILSTPEPVKLSIRYRGRSGWILTPGDRPDKRRPEADAPVSFDEPGVVSSLVGGV